MKTKKALILKFVVRGLRFRPAMIFEIEKHTSKILKFVTNSSIDAYFDHTACFIKSYDVRDKLINQARESA